MRALTLILTMNLFAPFAFFVVKFPNEARYLNR